MNIFAYTHPYDSAPAYVSINADAPDTNCVTVRGKDGHGATIVLNDEQLLAMAQGIANYMNASPARALGSVAGHPA